MVTRDDIVGSWRMIDRGTDNEHDHSQEKARWGEQSEGLAIFSADGWMNAIVCRGDRQAFSNKAAWHGDAPEDEKLQAFDSYLSYGGQWTFNSGVITTKVGYALNPSWVGGEQVRQAEMSPDGVLTLRLSRTAPDGRVINGWVRWRRAPASCH